jgi:hypothetical protein
MLLTFRSKAIAITTLIVIGSIGWLVPLGHGAPSHATGFSVAPFFWGAGVTLWRLAPFAIALAILRVSPKRRSETRRYP